jgi:hypothetical protein
LWVRNGFGWCDIKRSWIIFMRRMHHCEGVLRSNEWHYWVQPMGENVARWWRPECGVGFPPYLLEAVSIIVSRCVPCFVDRV